MVKKYTTILIGKAVKRLAAMRGGGSALPGLVVEKIDSQFLQRTLKDLPMGVLIISGTNGKTTTTKIVTELLEASGVKVFTNRTGSNFPRGVAAALLGAMDIRGKLDADIAVLELDEAWAVRFVEKVKPRYSLLLNVMRDQLDRFGEIDKTAELLKKVALATTGSVVMNQDDFRVKAIANHLHTEHVFYGVSDDLKPQIISQDQIDASLEEDTSENSVLLHSFDSTKARFIIDDQSFETKPSLHGIYNLQNAAAALCMARQILSLNSVEFSDAQLVKRLENIKPAFGRGETITINDSEVTLLLVKNPSGFQLSLDSRRSSKHIMIAINDNFADGRDMSWLWDVDFSSLDSVQMVSGVRAYDMTLRLGYDNIPVEHTETDFETALGSFLQDSPTQPKLIYCTYTSMLTIRKILASKTEMERVS